MQDSIGYSTLCVLGDSNWHRSVSTSRRYRCRPGLPARICPTSGKPAGFASEFISSSGALDAIQPSNQIALNGSINRLSFVERSSPRVPAARTRSRSNRAGLDRIVCANRTISRNWSESLQSVAIFLPRGVAQCSNHFLGPLDRRLGVISDARPMVTRITYYRTGNFKFLYSFRECFIRILKVLTKKTTLNVNLLERFRVGRRFGRSDRKTNFIAYYYSGGM